MMILVWMTSICMVMASFCLAEEGKEPPLTVGMELSYPPFEMVSPSGKPTGISVDIAEAFGKFFNRVVKIDNIPFIGLIPSLKTHKIDLIISSMSVTEERKASIDFSEPYLSTGLCLLISKKSTVNTIEEANQKGKIMAVKSGTSGEVYAAKHLNLATIIILDKESSCVMEVVQGKVDAFIYDQFSVFTHWQKNPTTTRALLKPFQKEEWAIGVRKGNQALLDRVNDFIKYFHEIGGFERLGDKYLPVQKEKFKELGIPFVF